MKTSLRLTTRQQLALTPQIQQTIRMLALGAKELCEEIDETLNNNPILRQTGTTTSSYDSTKLGNWIENQPLPPSQSIESHLIEQLDFLHLDAEVYRAVCIIISCLDDDGYLRLSRSDIIKEANKQDVVIDAQTIESALECIRQLEPVGIACCDLADCLKQQLAHSPKNSKASQHAILICDHLELLAQNPQALKKQLDLDNDSLEKALAILKRLNPSPAAQFNSDPTVFIQPDILLSISGEHASISLNPLISRGIEINIDYVSLLEKSKLKKDKNYLKKNLNNARWWMNALQQRNSTLMRVAQHMIQLQLDYFTISAYALKPLTQQNIADALTIHVSTVSRAIRGKYIQAPNGIIALNTLLAGRISTNKNNFLSNQSVKAIIRDLIKNESSQTPLSDSKIVEKLEIRGICIARRTVNKYREQLNIPASNVRRFK